MGRGGGREERIGGGKGGGGGLTAGRYAELTVVDNAPEGGPERHWQ
jgi:hypothetical protein